MKALLGLIKVHEHQNPDNGTSEAMMELDRIVEDKERFEKELTILSNAMQDLYNTKGDLFYVDLAYRSVEEIITEHKD